MTGYDERATARWVAEPPKRAGRSDFERDRARVLHSAALRRLAAKTQVVTAGLGRFPPHQADPLAGMRADRPGARPRARLRSRSGRRRLPGARHRPQPVRPQRRVRPGRAGRAVRRVRGQRPVAAPAQPARAEGPRRRPEPDPRHPRRHPQVPVAQPRPRHQVRRLRRGRRGVQLDQAGRAGRPPVPGGPGHGLGRRRRLLRPRPGRRLRGRPHHLQEPQFPGRTVRGVTDHGHHLPRAMATPRSPSSPRSSTRCSPWTSGPPPTTAARNPRPR